MAQTKKAPEGATDAPAGPDPEFVPDAPLIEPEQPEAGAEPPVDLPFISAGVMSDLEMQGWAGDPTTGGIFRKDAESGEITYTPRA